MFTASNTSTTFKITDTVIFMATIIWNRQARKMSDIYIQYNKIYIKKLSRNNYNDACIKMLRALIYKGNWGCILSYISILETSTLRDIFKDPKIWMECGRVSSDILAKLIQYCVEHGHWKHDDQKSSTQLENCYPNNQPQLQRFCAYGTVDHLKVLQPYFEKDVACPGTLKSQLGGHTALRTLMTLNAIVPDTKVKLEFLLKTYTYEINELRDVYLVAVDRHTSEIVEMIEMQLFNQFSAKKGLKLVPEKPKSNQNVFIYVNTITDTLQKQTIVKRDSDEMTTKSNDGKLCKWVESDLPEHSNFQVDIHPRHGIKIVKYNKNTISMNFTVTTDDDGNNQTWKLI